MTTGWAPTGPVPTAVDGVLTAAGPAGARAWIALDVEPLPGSAFGDGTDAERRDDAAHVDAGWLAGQWDPAGGTALELRYLHRPGGGVRCALLGRAYAPTMLAATSAALRLRERLGTVPAHVRAAPVGSAAEVQKLLDPFPAHPAGLFEVRKQIRPGLPSRPDAGVAYYLAIPRFAGGATSWERLWDAVADLPQPFMLTVGLAPYTPSPQFVGLLAELAARYGRLAAPGQTAASPLRQQSFALAADPFAAYAARLYADAWQHYQSGVFRMRITLASPEPLPAALVGQVATTICAPRGDGDITHVTVVPMPDELETAWRNVTTLDHARWDRQYLGHVPIPVPPALRQLAETVDAKEATSGWRLPPAPAAGGREVFVSMHVGDSINVGQGGMVVTRPTNSFNSARVQVGAQTEQADAARDPLRILLVCANPRGSQPLRTAEEDRTLRESIRISPDRDRIEIETLNAATIDDLRRTLLRRTFDVVHFSGHGTRQGLVFEDASGRLLVPSSEALAELLARRQVKVAVLNACYSLSVGRIRAIGTEYTIAASGPISDPAAIEFTRGFYDALGAGLTVPDAFEEGRGTAALKSLAFDVILLRRGEEHVAPGATGRPRAHTALVGVAVDVSGSMRGSISNSGAAGLTRFDSVRDSLADLGSQVGDGILRRSAGGRDVFRLFAYGYGLRVGGGVADLASVWRAAGTMGNGTAYRDLAVDADGYGLGPLVDPVEAAAVDTARQQLAAEVAELVVAETDRLGDTTLSAADVARLFDRTSSEELDSRILNHVLFGATPMVKAGRLIADRFARMDTEPYDERILLVVSDGEPTDGDPRVVFEELRKSGVTVISVYLTGEYLPDARVLVASPGDSWSKGARLMWELASAMDESSPIIRYLLSLGWSVEADARLCVQINHADVLREFVRGVGSRISSDERGPLPRGR